MPCPDLGGESNEGHAVLLPPVKKRLRAAGEQRLEPRLISVPGEGEWPLPSNLSFSANYPNQASEIDIVAIRPPGVRVIEVKHWWSRWIDWNRDLVEYESYKLHSRIYESSSGQYSRSRPHERLLIRQHAVGG